MSKPTVEDEIQELLNEFDQACLTRFYQKDVGSDIAIVDYYIGDEHWITLFEIYETDWSRVNIAGRTLKELSRIIGVDKC